MDVRVIRTSSHTLFDIEIHKNPLFLLRIFQGPAAASVSVLNPTRNCGSAPSDLIAIKDPANPKSSLNRLGGPNSTDEATLLDPASNVNLRL